MPVSALSIDLKNYRTVKQNSEARAVQALIAIEPAYFWALTESLLDDGYLATENILILNSGDSEFIVKEGNRRVAALKLIHGLTPKKGLGVPKNIEQRIDGLAEEWKKENESVPCTIFELKDEAKVDRIVKLAHGKGEKAGRVQWNAVARARHNRDHNSNPEPGLDLLEKYLRKGNNLSAQQKELWAGEYPLTVLAEMMSRFADRFDANNPVDLAKKYPKVTRRDILEQIMNDIGNGIIKFTTLRDKNNDFSERYRLPTKLPDPAPVSTDTPTSDPAQTPTGTLPTDPTNPASSPSSEPGAQPATPAPSPTAPTKVVAVAITDPRSITEALTKFVPRGQGREKLTTLRNEAIKLNLKYNPLAFCFVLRCMFELSAKAYCDDHAADPNGPKYLKSDNQTERYLVDVFRDIHSYMTHPGGVMDKTVTKELHGAITELTTPAGILSVTSMNQLIHSPVYTLGSHHICLVFGNIFPFLVAMNA